MRVGHAFDNNKCKLFSLLNWLFRKFISFKFKLKTHVYMYLQKYEKWNSNSNLNLNLRRKKRRETRSSLYKFKKINKYRIIYQIEKKFKY